MKSSRKAILITATVLVVAGTAIMLCAFALAGGDMKELSTDRRDWTRHTYELSSDEWPSLASIGCTDDSENVYFKGYEGDVLRVEYWENQNRGVSVQQDGDELSLIATTSGEPFVIGVSIESSEDHSTRVLVPRGFEGELHAECIQGDASVANIENAAKVSIRSESGFALATDLNARELTAKSNNGFVQCNSVNVKGDLNASSENGAVSLDSVNAVNLSVSSKNGAVSAGTATAQKNLFATSENGDITLHAIDAPEIETNTDNGATHITLPGSMVDYRIDAFSENGYVNIPAFAGHDGTRKVTARSRNGDLIIEYEGGNPTLMISG